MVETAAEGKVAGAQILQCEWSSAFEIEQAPQDFWRLDLSISPRPPGAEARFPHDGQRAIYRKLGRLFVVPPGLPLAVRSRAEPDEKASRTQKSVVCCIVAEEATRWLDQHPVEAIRTADLLDVHNQSLRGLLMRIANELTHPASGSDAVVDASAILIAIELSRHLQVARHAPPKGGLAARRLRLIEERIVASGPAPSIPELADICKLSVRHLMRGFQRSQGITLGAHIQAARLARAQRMLMNGTAIKEVAHDLGFASSASFCTTFKRLVGVSPGEYRRRT